MDQQLEKIIIECAKNIKKRKELFFKIGQEILKPLKDRELEEKTFEVFQLILQHEKDWKGAILLPEYYRLDKNKSIFKDIWYTLRDYFAWCVLYNTEVDSYFKHDKNGTVEVLENPKVRIMDKDNFKQVTKTENGKQVVVNVKKEKNIVIDSGFTLGQKDRILNVTVAGLIEIAPEQKKKAEKTSKKQIEDTTMPYDDIPQDKLDNNEIESTEKKSTTTKKTKKVEDTKISEEPVKPKSKKVTSTKKTVQVESEDKKVEKVESTNVEKNETKKKTTKSKKKE